MSASSDRSQIRLALAEDLGAPAVYAPWIGPLVALGGMASRYAEILRGRQLIVTISVPCREFAAALIGCGWAIARPAPRLESPLNVFRRLPAHTPVRVVTEREILADFFTELDDSREPSVILRRSQWLVSKVQAVAELPALKASIRSDRPGLGSLGRWAGLEATWNERLAQPSADLAIVGTLKWMRDDLQASLGTEGDSAPRDRWGTIHELLLPADPRAATWSTRLYSSSHLEEQLPISTEVHAALLDGAGAIKYLAEIETPVVVCILDRSVADESAAELVVQLRNSRGEPLSLRDEIGWRPPAGIEALAFTVSL